MSNKKRYLIKITEQAVETKIKGNDWEIGVDSSSETTYGYTPEIEKQVEVTREIFSQNTDELDLKAVIKAINGI